MLNKSAATYDFLEIDLMTRYYRSGVEKSRTLCLLFIVFFDALSIFPSQNVGGRGVRSNAA